MISKGCVPIFAILFCGKQQFTINRHSTENVEQLYFTL